MRSTEKEPHPSRPAGEGLRWTSWTAAVPYALAIAATFWFFRGTFFAGRLPGDTGDARWSITVLEHWFKVWEGEAAVRDLGVYHPIDRTLGLSDPFLAQGQFHALGRSLGLDPVPAWFVAHLITYVIGALGVAALSRRVLASPVQQTALVAMTVLSYPMVIQMNHVQSYAFLWISWVMWAIHGLLWPASRRSARRSAFVLLFLPPILALSSWYGLILGAMVLLVFSVVSLVLAGPVPALSHVRRFFGSFLGAVWSWPGLAFVVTGVGLWMAAAWVFVPSLGLLPEVEWSEVRAFSPRWGTSVFNAGLHGGGLWQSVYQRHYGQLPLTGETELGFTPFLIVAFVLANLAALFGVLTDLTRAVVAVSARGIRRVTSGASGRPAAHEATSKSAEDSDGSSGGLPSIDEPRPPPVDEGGARPAVSAPVDPPDEAPAHSEPGDVDAASTATATAVAAPPMSETSIVLAVLEETYASVASDISVVDTAVDDRDVDDGGTDGDGVERAAVGHAAASSWHGYGHVLACSMTVVFMTVFFLVDVNGEGMFKSVWERVSVLKSIRAPFRVQMLLYPMAMYAVLKAIEAAAHRGRLLRRSVITVNVLTLLVTALVLVEMYRPPNNSWTDDQLLPPELVMTVDEIAQADCDALVIDGSNASPLESTQINGTLVSIFTDIPTPHGYGRAAPEGHPGWDAEVDDLIDWLRDEGVDGRVCIATRNGLLFEG